MQFLRQRYVVKENWTEMKMRLEKIMRQLIMTLVLLLFVKTNFAQEIEFGKYRLCYDMYWRCHFQIFLELKPDSTYEFIYRDDTQMEKTTGTWHIEPDFLVLTPSVIPDTIKIVEVLEVKVSRNKSNIISFSEHFQEITNFDVNFFSKGKEFVLKTDENGEIQYQGDVIDSVTFVIKERELKVVPKKKDTPSVIRVRIDTNYKDLVYRTLGTNKIMIRDGRMFIKYRDEDTDGNKSELKTEYFERIE